MEIHFTLNCNKQLFAIVLIKSSFHCLALIIASNKLIISILLHYSKNNIKKKLKKNILHPIHHINNTCCNK